MTGASLTRMAVARLTMTGVSRRGAGVIPLGACAAESAGANKEERRKQTEIREVTGANYTRAGAAGWAGKAGGRRQTSG
jgi:hypothetical protein